MELSETIFLKRHSKRAYLQKPVPDDVLKRVFERVRWSPSCYNNQPWQFVLARDGESRKRFLDAMPEANRWAAAAPLLIALCAHPKSDSTRKDDPVAYHVFDSGIALMALCLAAVEEGLMAHPMAGYNAPGIKKALDIPDGHHVLCVVSLGYEGSSDSLDEATRKKDEAPRIRKPLEEVYSIDRFDFPPTNES